jgi:hypothetical protein
MKTSRIDRKELEQLKEENFKERLKFIQDYVEWMKKNSNKTWSAQQKDLSE